MLGILQARVKAGVEVKVIGEVSGRPPFDVRKLAGTRLHTRTMIRDRRRAFVGSQSLRAAELDSRREVGLIVRDPKAVKALIDTFVSICGIDRHEPARASRCRGRRPRGRRWPPRRTLRKRSRCSRRNCNRSPPR